MRAPSPSPGVAFGLLSGITFGTSGSLGASLIATGWTPGAVVTTRVAIAAAVLTPLALRQLRGRRLAASQLRTIGLYGVLAIGIAQLCYFEAIARMSVAPALLIEYSGILLVIGWGWLRHGRRPTRLVGLAVVVAVAGLALVLDLFSTQRVDVAGVLWALAAAVGLAGYFVISARTGEGVPPPVVMAWGGLVVGTAVLALVAVAGLLPMHTATADVTLLGRQVVWLLPVLGIALVAAVVAYLAGIAAVRRLGATLASFLGLSEVLAAVVFSWLLVGQQLDAAQLAGAALVVTGIALVRVSEVRPARAAVPPTIPAGAIA